MGNDHGFRDFSPDQQTFQMKGAGGENDFFGSRASIIFPSDLGLIIRFTLGRYQRIG